MTITRRGDVIVLLVERFAICGIALVIEDGEPPSLMVHRWTLHNRGEAGSVATTLARGTHGRILVWNGDDSLIEMTGLVPDGL